MAAIVDYNFTMVKRGLMSQVSQALSFSRCFRFNSMKRSLRVKTPRGKEILRGKFKQLARQRNTQEIYCSQAPYITRSLLMQSNAFIDLRHYNRYYTMVANFLHTF